MHLPVRGRGIQVHCVHTISTEKVCIVNNMAFSALSLKQELLQGLTSLKYDSMTPIQAASLPTILQGKDIIAQAKTGSGKTAAFGLGILNQLDIKKIAVQCLVLCPTRELADQVATEIRNLARKLPNVKVTTLCGGQPLGPQIGSLAHPPHIVVGTPGRIEKLLGKEKLKVAALTSLVLDEADRMLDMGFEESLDAIVAQLPTKRQTLLFSATYPDKIHKIAQRIMQDAERIKADTEHDNVSIQQFFYPLPQKDLRSEALRLLLLEHQPASAIVFCVTKLQTEEVAHELRQHGFSALAINGDLEQKQRMLALAQFANKSINVLVATDVAARGLDIDQVDAVINYFLPLDPEVYVHRIGRSGRAGHVGCAYSLYADKERRKLKLIMEYIQSEVVESPLPNARHISNIPPRKMDMITLQIDAGKKQKIRAGDILGALTGDNGVNGSDVGKIQLFDHWSCVAVAKTAALKALKKLQSGRLKGRSCRARLLQHDHH